MSRASIGFALMAICSVILSGIAEEIKLYTTKYDYVDYDEILGNDRIRNQYYNCFLESGPCLTADAIFFKEKFPEALVTKCKYCTEKQKIGFEKIVTYYTEKEPEAWELVLKKAIENSQNKPKE